MIEGNARLEDVASVLEVLRVIPEAFDAAALDATKTFKLDAEGGTPRGRTGRAKRSWGRIQQSRAGYSFRNVTPYIGILEEGLYERVGPRTQEWGGQIYSRQAIGGILAPLLEDEQYLEKVAQSVVNMVMEGMNRAGA